MDQSKFSLADCLAVLGALAFGFFCFLGFNFLSLGDTASSVTKAALFVLLLGGLALGAKWLKKTSRNFKTCMIWEWIFILLFVVSAVVAIVPFSHYFAVSDQKKEIQAGVIANIEQGEKMFIEYDDYVNGRTNNYKDNLEKAVSTKKANPAKYDKYGFKDDISDSTQMNTLMFILETKLMPSNYGAIKDSATKWLEKKKAIIENWTPTGIVEVINKADINILAWRDKLIGDTLIERKDSEFSAFRADGEEEKDFAYELEFANVTDKLTKKGAPTPLSVIFAICLYVLMLLSWFITRRHPRYPGLKMVFGIGDVMDNELS